MSMDKIIKQVDDGTVPNKEDDPNISIMFSSCSAPVQPPVPKPRSRIQSRERKKERFLDKAVLSYLGEGGGQGSPVDPPARPVVLPSQFKFSVGDRVVVQTVRGRAVTGTVRWVGLITAAGKVTIPWAAVGIETVSCVSEKNKYWSTDYNVNVCNVRIQIMNVTKYLVLYNMIGE